MPTTRGSIPRAPTPLTPDQRLRKAQRDADRAADAALAAGADADQALLDAAEAKVDADAAQLAIDETLSGDRTFTGLQVEGQRVEDFLSKTDGAALDDPAAVPMTVIEAQVRAAVSGSGDVTYNPITGGFGLSLSSGSVTGALGYTPTSVTGLTGAQSVAAFKTGLSLVKADVGLGSVDNTADAAKAVLSAAKLTTARTINGVSFDGSGNITINAVDSTARVPESRTISTTAPLTGGGDLSGNRTLAITAATPGAAGSMSAADKAKLDAISGTNTGDQTNITGNAGTATALLNARAIDGQSFNGTANITVIAPGTTAATSKSTPVDADELPLVDSAASNILKKLTWANLKATLKSYFDTLYIGSAAGTAWTIYTPAVTTTGGAPTTFAATARYKQIGKTVHWWADVTLTTLGPASGNLHIDLPTTPQSLTIFHGRDDNTGLSVQGRCLAGAATVYVVNYTGASLVSAGAHVIIDGTYESQ